MKTEHLVALTPAERSRVEAIRSTYCPTFHPAAIPPAEGEGVFYSNAPVTLITIDNGPQDDIRFLLKILDSYAECSVCDHIKVRSRFGYPP